MTQILIKKLHEKTVEIAAKVHSESFWKRSNEIRQQLLTSSRLFSDSAKLIRDDRNR